MTHDTLRESLTEALNTCPGLSSQHGEKCADKVLRVLAERSDAGRLPAMTAEELDQIEARAEAAVPGPWQVLSECPPGNHHHQLDEIWVGTSDRVTIAELGERYSSAPEDAEFIAHARTDVPALAAEVRRLLAAVDAANKRLIDSAGFDVADLMYSLDECTARAERAEAAVSAALALHEPRQPDLPMPRQTWCSCGQAYPCPTRRALTERPTSASPERTI